MKTNQFRILLLAGISLVASQSLKAQVTARVGPEVGIGIVGMDFNKDYSDGSSYAGLSAHAGATAEFQFGRFFALRPSVFIQTRSFSDAEALASNGNNGGTRFTNNNIYVPLDAVFTMKRASGTKFFVGLGPYFAYTFSGRFRQGNAPSDKLYLGTGVNNDMNPVDIGLNVKLGFQMANNLFFNFGFDYGITNRAPYDYDATSNTSNYSIKDMQLFNFGIGYLFGPKDKPAKGGKGHDRYRTYRRSY